MVVRRIESRLGIEVRGVCVLLPKRTACVRVRIIEPQSDRVIIRWLRVLIEKRLSQRPARCILVMLQGLVADMVP